MTSDPLAIDLALRIREFQERFLPKLPPDVADALARSIEDLVRSGVGKHAVGEGDPAPRFALASHRGATVSLDETLARGPAVVAFYRGEW